MIIAVVPSRGRPERARQAVDALYEFAELETTRVIVAVDHDDPAEPMYHEFIHGTGAALHVLKENETGDLVKATNSVSMRLAEWFPTAIIGNLGDDHLARTQGWDRAIEAALVAPGIAYGDDLLQRDHLPTAPFISAAIVRALGWYALPTVQHMFIDDAWKAIGLATGRLIYLSDVVFEHMHPGAGKAKNDAGYERADSSTEADRLAYQKWFQTERKLDVEKIRAAVA